MSHHITSASYKFIFVRPLFAAFTVAVSLVEKSSHDPNLRFEISALSERKDFWVGEDLGSDHNTIIGVFSHTPLINELPPPTVMLYHKADWKDINQTIKHYDQPHTRHTHLNYTRH